MWTLSDDRQAGSAVTSVAAGEHAITDALQYLIINADDAVSILEGSHIIGTVRFCASDQYRLHWLKQILADPDWDIRWSFSGSVLCLHDLGETTSLLLSYARGRNIPVHLCGLHWDCIRAKEQYPNLKSFQRILLSADQTEWIEKCWLHYCLARAAVAEKGISIEEAASQMRETASALEKPTAEELDYAAYCKVIAPAVLGRFIKLFAAGCGKQIALVYGNCHFHVLTRYLLRAPAFTQRYCLVVIPPVFEMEELEIRTISESLLENTDLIIYQQIRQENLYGAQWSTEELLSRLPRTCIRICIPNTVFFGYFPQEGPRHDTILKNQINRVPMFCGDKYIDAVYQSSRSIRQTVAVLSSPDYLSEDQVAKNLNRSFRILELQDLGCDIPMRDFVIREFRRQHLFTEPKHPTNPFFREMSERILRKIGLSDRLCDPESLDKEDTLSTINRLLYPSVIKHLGLQFDCDSYYCDRRLTNQKLSFAEFIELYIRNTFSADDIEAKETV